MKIVEELADMRWHRVELVKKAVGQKRKGYVSANNRSEGNTPFMIPTLSTTFVESTVNQAVPKHMITKQQMGSNPRKAHLLLQVSTRVPRHLSVSS